MKRTFAHFIAGCTLCFLVAACNNDGASGNDGDQQSSLSSTSAADEQAAERPPRVTRNVYYEGVVEPAGISIYMEGSHKLMIDEKTFILLRSDTADLNGYVGERVEVFGSVQPTVEAGAMIMDVERISLKEMPTASGSSTSSVSSVASSSVSSAASSVAVSSAASSSSTPPKTTPSSQPSTSTPPPSGSYTANQVAQAETMSKEDLDSARWTQRYCTEHIGFCIPVHKNWWFKSFGNTTTKLWHVEIGTQELDVLYDGALYVDLVSGDLTTTGASNKQVRVANGEVIGYLSWIGNEHFEIRGPASLEPIVRYLIEHFEEMPTSEE